MTWIEAVFLIIIFLSNVIQTITGFAGTALAMPFSLLILEETVVKPVLNIVALGVCLFIVIRHFKEIDWKEALWMALFISIGFAGGILVGLLPHDGTIFLRVYGGVIIAVALLFLFIHPEKHNVPTWVLLICLVLGGFVHALYISGGPLVVIFAMLKIKDKHKFRATLSFIWIIFNSALLIEHGIQGLLTPHVGLLAGIGLAATVVSIVIGQFLARRMPKNVFMIATNILLLISGVLLVIPH